MKIEEVLGRIGRVCIRATAALKLRQAVRAYLLLARGPVLTILEGILAIVGRLTTIRQWIWNTDASNKILPIAHQLARIVQIAMQSRMCLLGHVGEVRCRRPEAEAVLLILSSMSRQPSPIELLPLLAHRIDILVGRLMPTILLRQLLQTPAGCTLPGSSRLHLQLILLALADSHQAVLLLALGAAPQLTHRLAHPLRAEVPLRPVLLPVVMASAVALAHLEIR